MMPSFLERPLPFPTEVRGAATVPPGHPDAASANARAASALAGSATRDKRARVSGWGRPTEAPTWPDPLRPVHRHDVGACEHPDRRSSSTARCPNPADATAPVRQTRLTVYGGGHLAPWPALLQLAQCRSPVCQRLVVVDRPRRASGQRRLDARSQGFAALLSWAIEGAVRMGQKWRRSWCRQRRWPPRRRLARRAPRAYVGFGDPVSTGRTCRRGRGFASAALRSWWARALVHRAVPMGRCGGARRFAPRDAGYWLWRRR